MASQAGRNLVAHISRARLWTSSSSRGGPNSATLPADSTCAPRISGSESECRLRGNLPDFPYAMILARCILENVPEAWAGARGLRGRTMILSEVAIVFRRCAIVSTVLSAKTWARRPHREPGPGASSVGTACNCSQTIARQPEQGVCNVSSKGLSKGLWGPGGERREAGRRPGASSTGSWRPSGRRRRPLPHPA